MKGQTSRGVSRRGFLLTLVAACACGLRARVPAKALDDALIGRMAEWAG